MQGECKHHWVLDEVSFGVCKLCGDEKQFPRLGDIDELDIWRGHHPSKKDRQVVDDGVGSMPEKPDTEVEVTTVKPAPSTVTCSVCGKEGIGVRGLPSHLYFKHRVVKSRLVPVAPKRKSFECPYCSAIYPTGKALGPHIRFKHPEKTFERRYGTKIVPLADKEAALLATADHIGRLIDALDTQKAKLIDLLTLTMQGVLGPLPGTIK